MKKLFKYTALLVAVLILSTSCEKEEIGKTKTSDMAGEWYVKVYAVDQDGEVVYDDPFDNGMFHLDTYNTSADNETEMWIDDHGNFYEFKTKINVNLGAMTFQVDSAANEYYEVNVQIDAGKILYGAATTPSGSVADSIVFNVGFGDDTYPAAYGYHNYRIQGFRYTGLTGDE